MKTTLDLLTVSRNNIIEIIKDLSLEQLNQIPLGFNNNIAWNIGHLTATHIGLIYTLSGVENDFPTDFIQKFKKGTKPEQDIDQQEFELMTTLVFNQVDDLKRDIEANVFAAYKPYKTSYNY